MLFAFSCFLSGLAAPCGQVAVPFDPMNVVKASIEAHGGTAALERLALSSVCRQRIIRVVDGKLRVLHQHIWFKPPNKMKLTLTSGDSLGPIKVVQVINGTSGKVRVGANPTQPFSAEMMADWSRRFDQEQAITLLPLLEFGKFDLTSKGIAMVRGRPCYEIAVSKKRDDICTLFVDRGTHRFVKLSVMLDKDARRAPLEVFIDEYGQFGNVKSPRRSTIYWSGELLSVNEVLEYRPDQPRDDEFFSKIE
jgi:hypothetical protein